MQSVKQRILRLVLTVAVAVPIIFVWSEIVRKIAYAQTFGVIIDAFQALQQQDIVPQFIPNASTPVGLAQDFYYTDIRVSNVTAGAVTLTILDRQGTPAALAQAVSVPANGVIQFTCVHGCRLPGGFSWQAGAATSLIGYVRGYYN